MDKITVSGNTGNFIKNGNSWIYGKNILNKVKGNNVRDVRIYDEKNVLLGSGLYNPDALIKVRILNFGKDEVEFNYDFFKDKVEKAYKFRKKIYGEKSSYRLIFSEGDLFSGLICDVYNKGVVTLLGSKGLENHREKIYKAIDEVIKPDFIYEKENDSPEKVNSKGLIKGEIPADFKIEENGISYIVDVVNGQKTGFFLDQYLNRKNMELYSENSKVLDVFCNSGGFGLNALKYGASHVSFLDSSQEALDGVKQNLLLNKVKQEKFDIIKSDAFSYMEKNDGKYDLIILDPPAFTKSSKNISKATSAYQFLNIKALSMLNEGGILATFSCSQNITEDIFRAVVKNSCFKAHGIYSILSPALQSYDHPVIPSQNETHYLKGFFIRKLG